MTLYIRQKVFSWGDQFTIKDQFGEDKYIVRGEIFPGARNCTSMT